MPVVLANEQHPTGHEMRSGACEVCTDMCKMFGLLTVAFIIVAYLSSDASCGVEANATRATSAPGSCLDVNSLDKLLPVCNTCGASQDSACDEGDPYSPEGQCPQGTDGFDCAVEAQTRGGIQDASGRAPYGSSSYMVLLLGFGWFMVAPFVLCGAYCCCKKQCGACRFTSLPVVSDMIFEVVRSRGLAVVEQPQEQSPP